MVGPNLAACLRERLFTFPEKTTGGMAPKKSLVGGSIAGASSSAPSMWHCKT